MTERQFQSLFTAWLKTQAPWSAAYELKLAKTPRLPFRALQEHQAQALRRVKVGTLAFKISDMAMGYKPFDCFSLVKAGAYVVVMFFEPRKRRCCYLMDVEHWLEYQARSSMRSITEAECETIGRKIYL